MSVLLDQAVNIIYVLCFSKLELSYEQMLCLRQPVNMYIV